MKVAEFIGKIRDLPALPAIAHQINVASMKEEVTARELGEIIEKDPALAGKLLKLANSSFYGLVREVTTIERAVTLLGFITVKNFATSASISSMFAKSRKKSSFDLKGLWMHNLGCAVAAETLVSRKKPGQGDEAFLCGILHDIGCSVLLENLPEKMEMVAALMELRKISQSDAEMEVLGVTHGEVGAYLAEKWKFPERFQYIIEFHHNPDFPSLDMENIRDVQLVAVYAGNYRSKSLGIGKSFDQGEAVVDPRAWHFLDVAEEELEGIGELIREKSEEVRRAFE